MKVQDTHKAEKAQNNQAIAKTLAGSRSTARAAKDAVLAQEFSDLMAKIADQLQNVQGEAALPGMSALLKAENSARAQAAAKQETPKTDAGNGKDKQPNENKGPSDVAIENKQVVAAKKEEKAADKVADKTAKEDKKADKDSDDNAQSDSQAASSASDAPTPVPAKPTDAKPVKEHAEQEDAQGQTQQQATPNQNQEQQAANQQNQNPAPQANVVAQAAAEQTPAELVQTPEATPAQKCASPVKEEVAQTTAQPQSADANSTQNLPTTEAASIQNATQSSTQIVKTANQAPVAPQAAAQAQAAAPVVENVESVPAQTPLAAAPEVQAVNNSTTSAAVTEQVAKPVVDKPVSDQAIFFEQLINRVGTAQRDVPVAQDREVISALRDATISPLILKDSMDAALVKGLDSSKGLMDAKATSTFNLSTQAIEASNLRQTETASKTELAKAVKPLPRPVEVRTMEKIENALKEAARSKDGKTISLRLDPPSLGSVKVDVTLKDNALHARVVGETPQVNNLLRERAPELQQMLRKLGLNVDKVNVSVSGDDAARQEASFAGQTGLGTNRRQTQRGNLGQGTVLNQDDSARIRQQYEVMDHWVA